MTSSLCKPAKLGSDPDKLLSSTDSTRPRGWDTIEWDRIQVVVSRLTESKRRELAQISNLHWDGSVEQILPFCKQLPTVRIFSSLTHAFLRNNKVKGTHRGRGILVFANFQSRKESCQKTYCRLCMWGETAVRHSMSGESCYQRATHEKKTTRTHFQPQQIRQVTKDGRYRGTQVGITLHVKFHQSCQGLNTRG